MKTNYLNNKDLLSEIHASKTSYCSFKNPATDSVYDIILDSVDDVKKNLLLAKENKIAKLEKEGIKHLTPKDIANSALVFRVMTWDHIPAAPPKVSKKKSKNVNLVDELELENTVDDFDAAADELIPKEAINLSKVKVNFPPFFHYRFCNDEKGSDLEIVGKSHWIGDLDTGHFSKTHGQITDKLALMYMKLCERYATRANWRNYTYNDEMKAQSLLQIVQVGLQFNEAKSSNPFSYLSMCLQNSFTRILNIEKKNQAIRDDLLEQKGYNPSMTRQMKQNAMGSLD